MMRGTEASEAFIDFLNGATNQEKQEFVNNLMIEHRTLQQNAFDLFMDCVASWAQMEGTMRYDDRNQAAVRVSKKIVDEVFNK